MPRQRTIQNAVAALVVLCITVVFSGCPEKREIVKPTPKVTVVKVEQPEEFYNLGVDALKANDLDKAAASFRQAIAKYHNAPDKQARAQYNLGVVLLHQGDHQGQ